MIELTIRRKLSDEGHPFSELLFVVHPVTGPDEPKHYLSRRPYVIDDERHTRAYEIQQFRKRQGWV